MDVIESLSKRTKLEGGWSWTVEDPIGPRGWKHWAKPTHLNQDGRGSDEHHHAVSHGAASRTKYEITRLDDDDDIDIGTIASDIVGIRYYSGRISPEESVMLIREPSNPYDSNAIRVCNMMGAQIGHLSARVALLLAPHLDTHQLRPEATVLSKSQNAFSIPISIRCFCNSNAAPALMTALASVLNIERVRSRPALNQGLELPSSSSSSSTANSSRQPVSGALQESHYLSRIRTLEEQIEALYDVPSGLGVADPPEDFLLTLKPFQQQGLKWLLMREQEQMYNSHIWKKTVGEDGEELWQNVLTHYCCEVPEPEITGGILADEMGLGKTIQMLALIGANTNFTAECFQTLVICPVSVLSHWEDDNRRCYGSKMALFTYHGSNRRRNEDNLAHYDIILTTYSVLSAEMKVVEVGGRSILFDTLWNRVILDEGHNIREDKTKTHQAALELQANHRWILSGTPIQNRCEDMQSLLAFLRVMPLGDKKWWNSLVKRGLKSLEDGALNALKGTLKPILLRRTKKTEFEGQPILSLPPKEMFDHIVHLSDRERTFYDSLLKSSREQFSVYLVEGTVLKNYATILALVLRLRQVCDSLDLIIANGDDKSMDELKSEANLLGKTYEEAENEECCICFEIMGEESLVVTKCAHAFCRNCMDQLMSTNTGEQPACPLCRAPIAPGSLMNSQTLHQIKTAIAEYKSGRSRPKTLSSKLLALLEDIGNVPSDEKMVIFSQWTSMLDCVTWALDHETTWKYVRLDGTMSHRQRTEVLRTFRNDPEVRIILVSLHAGSTGLSLVSANHVFMLDPWWNPHAEDQAIDRCHRFGQNKPVRVYTYITENSMEEKIRELQLSKREKAINVLGGEPEKVEEYRNRRVRELQRLFE